MIQLIPDTVLIFEISKKDLALKIVNRSEGPIAFKVKTSSPKHFLVSPSSAIIPQQSFKDLKISLINPEEALQKNHKFLIQALQSNDLNKINWNASGLEEHKLVAKINSSEYTPGKEDFQNRGTVYIDADSNKDDKNLKPRNTFSTNDKVFEENKADKHRNSEVHFDFYEGASSPNRNKRSLQVKTIELENSIENLKAEVSKAELKLRFSKDLERLSYDSVGKYGIFHLAIVFFLAFFIGKVIG